MRSQAMAIFFGIGLGVGGVISPYFFGKLIEAQNLELGCYIAGALMIYAGIVGFIFGVDAENKPLEQISQFD